MSTYPPNTALPIYGAYTQVSAQAADLEARLAMLGGVSAKDPAYGAKGDGVTDDTAALQAALNAGGLVVLPVGTYLVGDLTIGANTSLIGMGWGAHLKKKATATYLLSVNPGSGGTSDPTQNARNITIANLWLEGLSGTAFSQFNHMLNLNAASDVLVEGCHLTSFEGDAIYLGSSNVAATERHNERITIRHCVFDGVNKQNRNAISVVDGTDVLIADNDFTRCSRSDMPGAVDLEPDANAFARIRNVQIVGNRFRDIGGNVAAVAMYLPLGQAALTTPVRGIVIARNLIDTAAAAGIALTQTEDKADASVGNAITVRDNVVLTTSRGVTMQGVKGVRVLDNAVSTTTLPPLIGYFGSNTKCQDILLRNNRWEYLDTTSGSGLSIFAVDRLTMQGDVFAECGKADGTFGYALDFNTGTSSRVTLDGVRIVNSTGRTKIAVQKEAGHTFTAATNVARFCDWAGLANNFVGAQLNATTAGGLTFTGASGTTTALAAA